LDVHKDQITVALISRDSQQVENFEIRNESKGIRRLTRRLGRAGKESVQIAYEAGPCGYALQRQLQGLGFSCVVIAPSLIPVKPGERIKTDRRDAEKLARSLRANLLTEVRPPTPAEEAARDLFRCRQDARADITRARHRLSKMLLRRGHVYRVGKNWTLGHRNWMRKLRFEDPCSQAVFDDYWVALEHLEQRIDQLDQRLAELADTETYRERAGWLRCFRGIDTVTAMGILTELHGFDRFTDPRQLKAYLRLVPSEHSSAARQSRGGITKAGNSSVRRLLIEAAWHYRHRPGVGVKLRQRRREQPVKMIALADRAQQRLHRRYSRLVLGRGKQPQKAAVAVARELAGFVWAALYLYPRLEEAAVATN
jgi:transposase